MPVIRRFQNVSTASAQRHVQLTRVSADTRSRTVETIAVPSSQFGDALQALCRVELGRRQGLNEPGHAKQPSSQPVTVGYAADPRTAAEHLGFPDNC